MTDPHCQTCADADRLRARLEALAEELATLALYHSKTPAGDAYADASDRITAALDGDR